MPQFDGQMGGRYKLSQKVGQIIENLCVYILKTGVIGAYESCFERFSVLGGGKRDVRQLFHHKHSQICVLYFETSDITWLKIAIERISIKIYAFSRGEIGLLLNLALCNSCWQVFCET